MGRQEDGSFKVTQGHWDRNPRVRSPCAALPTLPPCFSRERGALTYAWARLGTLGHTCFCEHTCNLLCTLPHTHVLPQHCAQLPPTVTSPGPATFVDTVPYPVPRVPPANPQNMPTALCPWSHTLCPPHPQTPHQPCRQHAVPGGLWLRGLHVGVCVFPFPAPP